jgi:hypothetical protein
VVGKPCHHRLGHRDERLRRLGREPEDLGEALEAREGHVEGIERREHLADRGDLAGTRNEHGYVRRQVVRHRDLLDQAREGDGERKLRHRPLRSRRRRRR